MSSLLNAAIYDNLDTSKNEIRLLYLQPPGLVESKIQCKLIRANLDQLPLPQYEALSYEWGTASSDYDIFVADQPFMIRANLYSALLRLRQPGAARALWIDALCINQEHIGERNHQVKVMGEIYRRASRVIIWLGERSWAYQENVLFTGDILQTLMTLWDSKLPTASKYKPSEEKMQFDGTDAKGRRHLMHSSFDVSNWVHVEHFFRLTYWSRLWILQEVLSASKIIIQYDRQIFDWEYLENMVRQFEHAGFRQLIQQIDRIDRSRGHTRDLLRHIEKMDELLMTVPARLCQQRFNRHKSGPRPQALMTLVLRYRDSECFDLRDKIFGLYSLSNSCCQDAVSVDYMKTTAQIYSALLRHHLAHHPEDAGGESLQVISLTKELSKILGVTPSNCSSMEHYVRMNRYTLSSTSLVSIVCYLRGKIVYNCRPADVTRILRANQDTSEVAMPTGLNRKHWRNMRSFLKDAENEFLPTLCKPGKLKDRSDRLEVFCSKMYNTLIACLKRQSIWNEWLWGLELPDHEALWDDLPYTFFTADGQIGLSAEEFQIGDIVLEFDRKNADCVVVREVGDESLIVGTAHAVLGAWGTTPKGSLERITLGLGVETLEMLSDCVNRRPAENLIFRSSSMIARPVK